MPHGNAGSEPKKALHIAVGVLQDPQGKILIAQRRAGTPGAGKWEFPGGKREPGESIRTTLGRELEEELGVEVAEARPMLRFHHGYSDRRVLLDVWAVSHWRGQARGCEGQKLQWCEPARLYDYDLLSANKPIVDAIRLPCAYAITPEPGENTSGFLDNAEAVAASGIQLLRLRAWNLSDAAYESLADALKSRLRNHATALVLDRTSAMVARLGAAGLHLPAHRLESLTVRPVPAQKWFAVSCHNRDELLRAAAAGADFAVLSPVKTTPSHVHHPSLGWTGFAAARAGIALPVYALGGMGVCDLHDAWQHGAQGVAAIRGLW